MEIVDQVGLFGVEWVFDAWKMIQEDRVDRYRMLAMVAPLARTPMDKKSAASMKKYAQDLTRGLENATPWRNAPRSGVSRRDRVEPGKVVVFLEEGEAPNDPLYAGAVIARG